MHLIKSTSLSFSYNFSSTLFQHYFSFSNSWALFLNPLASFSMHGCRANYWRKGSLLSGHIYKAKLLLKFTSLSPLQVGVLLPWSWLYSHDFSELARKDDEDTCLVTAWIFLHILQHKCVLPLAIVIPSNSGGKARAMTRVCNMYSGGNLWKPIDQQLKQR